MPVVVIADSAAALDPAMASSLDIVTVPMQLEIGQVPVDESTVGLEEVIDRFDEGVTTSAPSPGAFLGAIEARDDPDGAVILTVGQQLSSSYQAAATAASMAPRSSAIRVVDTGTAAGAEGLVVLAAAEEAATGASLDAVVARAREVAERVRLVAAVEELTYLARGGRVPAVAAWAGDRLGVHPLFELSHAKIRPLRPAFGSDRTLDQIVAQWRRTRPPAGRLRVAALHALREKDAHELLASVRAEVEPVLSFVGTFGAVMVAHTGPSVIGLAWWWE